jgi:hypothetical protein
MTHQEADMTSIVTIRTSTDQDQKAISRLAELDSRKAPQGPALLGIVEGELQAALPLNGGPAVADPFRQTAEIVELLQVRAAGREQKSLGSRGLTALRLKAA